MEKQILIKFDANYADEFDVEGFVVMSASAWEEHKTMAKEFFENGGHAEQYFGTNEYVEFDSYEDYMSAIKTTELDETQYEVLETLFNEHRNAYTWKDIDGQDRIVPASNVIRYGILAMLTPEDMKDG